MARLPLTKAFLDATYPETYHELNFSHPVATIDGTDVACQTVRTDRYINVVQASIRYTHLQLVVSHGLHRWD